jgi:hypothetical protein
MTRMKVRKATTHDDVMGWRSACSHRWLLLVDETPIGIRHFRLL